jgi:hypothetical protein
MKGVTGRPTTGARLSVELAEEGPEALIYRGFVHLPDADVPAEARVELPSGAVKMTLGPGGTPALERVSAALVRAATKAAVAGAGAGAGGGVLPRKIARWRG